MTDGRSRVPLALIRPEGRRVMPKYLIERDSRKRGSSRPSSFGTSRGGRARSSNALGRRSSGCRLVTDDRIYYVYIAPDEELVRSHAQHGRFPANRSSRVRTVIDPTTAED